jgi:hypothetical protein
MTLESAALGNLIQIALLVVTGFGALLIVRQLKEARLASQMEGLIVLQNRYREVLDKSFPLIDMTDSPDWAQLSEKEKAAQLEKTEELKVLWRSIASHYELVAALVRSGSLDKKAAFDLDGILIVNWYKRLEPIIEARRLLVGPELFAHFEWLADEFRKME